MSPTGSRIYAYKEEGLNSGRPSVGVHLRQGQMERRVEDSGLGAGSLAD